MGITSDGCCSCRFSHDAWRVCFPGIKDSIECTIDPEDRAPAMREVSESRASQGGRRSRRAY